METSTITVHPRVGGEHLLKRAEAGLNAGSSPRGRGTQDANNLIHHPLRFIPAWAGNTWRKQKIPRVNTVHPRVGGEHLINCIQPTLGFGSSPRGRGTLDASPVALTINRFIPAWAGNTSSNELAPLAETVHPRVGGEHRFPQPRLWFVSGSSPRGRGTRRRRDMHCPIQRFIPAWAGNTTEYPSASLPKSVHPRVGGEHCERAPHQHLPPGSSPRGRGTLRAGTAPASSARFIPAWAGNTGIPSIAGRCNSVHPRVGGEHWTNQENRSETTGSSPRGRGTPSIIFRLT